MNCDAENHRIKNHAGGVADRTVRVAVSDRCNCRGRLRRNEHQRLRGACRASWIDRPCCNREQRLGDGPGHYGGAIERRVLAERCAIYERR